MSKCVRDRGEGIVEGASDLLSGCEVAREGMNDSVCLEGGGGARACMCVSVEGGSG